VRPLFCFQNNAPQPWGPHGMTSELAFTLPFHPPLTPVGRTIRPILARGSPVGRRSSVQAFAQHGGKHVGSRRFAGMPSIGLENSAPWTA
jgi:hypothetical protein